MVFLFTMRLERYHIQYDLASSGQEAMKSIRQMTGYEPGSAHKIIALTANVVEGAEGELLAFGFEGFFGKPMDSREFELVLCRVLPDTKIDYEEM